MRVSMFIAVLALAACGPQQGPAKDAAPEGGAAVVPGPSDPAAKLAAATIPAETETYDKELSVDQVATIDAGGKIFSTVGGDPAINGVYTFLAVPAQEPDGPEFTWRVFKLGDFNSWELVEQSPTRVVLKISHSIIDQASGEARTAEQKIAVALPPPDAKSVSITPLD